MKTFLRKLIPDPLILLYHKTLAVLANMFYGFPSKSIKVIGVTGTNGKTTTCNLIYDVLVAAGYKCGLTTSINFKIGEKEWINKTKQGMQGRFKLQKLIRQMVRSKCQYAIIETTSEGIKQYRHWGIDYNIAVFTNLTPEHIESHGSFGAYKKAKAELFKALQGKGISIVNGDSEHSEFFAGFDAETKWIYGLNFQFLSTNFQSNPNFQILKPITYNLKPHGSEFSIKIKDQEHTFKTQLLGKFNIYNSLAAICVALSQNIDISTIKSTLAKIKPIPGRMEVIHDKKRNITIVVDYAHDPAALENVYRTLLKTQNSNIVAVLGAVGGGRDTAKRPKLGALASKYAKYVIVTNEDPYDDNPEAIMDQVEQGVKKDPKRKINKNYWRITDRRIAIKKSIEIAQSGSIIALTGKGCEEVMAVKGGFIPWDDRQIVRELLS